MSGKSSVRESIYKYLAESSSRRYALTHLISGILISPVKDAAENGDTHRPIGRTLKNSCWCPFVHGIAGPLLFQSLYSR